MRFCNLPVLAMFPGTMKTRGLFSLPGIPHLGLPGTTPGSHAAYCNSMRPPVSNMTALFLLKRYGTVVR